MTPKDYLASTPPGQSQPHFSCALSLSSSEGVAHRSALMNIFGLSSALSADFSAAVCHTGSVWPTRGSSAQPFPKPGAAEGGRWPGCCCPAHTAAPSQGDFLMPPHPCPRSWGRQKVKTRGKSESRPLPLTDASCSLPVNFREAKISSVSFRICAGKAAGYGSRGNPTLAAFRRTHRNTPLPLREWYQTQVQ